MFRFSRRPGARPVRRTATVLVRTDPKTGVSYTIPIDEQETSLSPEGSPDTISTQHLQCWDCGHSTSHRPLGGQCTCGQVSCVDCHRQCANLSCRRPLCPACSYAEPGREAADTVVCRSCREQGVRRRAIQAALRFLTAPFVIREEQRRP